MRIIKFILLFLSFSPVAYNQSIPMSATEKMMERAFYNIQPSTDAKSLLEKVQSIKDMVIGQQSNRSNDNIKGELLSECRNLGYDDDLIEDLAAKLDDIDLKDQFLVSIKMAKSEEVLEWSGYEESDVMDSFIQGGVVQYGTAHRKYDPRKDFWTDSSMRPNPFDYIGNQYVFDLRMKIHIDAGFEQAEMEVWVNSKDASFGFDADEISQLFRGGSSGNETDFVVANTQGKGIGFRSGDGRREAAMIESMPLLLAIIGYTGYPDKDAAYNEIVMSSNQLEVYHDEQLSDDTGVDSRDIKCYSFREEGSTDLNLCFQNGHYPIYTLMPRLGIGVGIFKDYTREENYVVLRALTSSSMGIPIKTTLLELEQTIYQFDATPYQANRHHDTKITRAKIKAIEEKIDEKETEKEIKTKNYEERKLGIKEMYMTQIRGCGGESSCRQAAKDRYHQQNQAAFEAYKSEMDILNNEIDQKLDEIKSVKKTGR